MREVIKEKLPVFQEVSFSVTAPQAKEVYLVGDFNNWKIEPRFRMQQENGAWKKKVELTSGRHYYRFVIDGSWTEDTSNPHKQVNSFGWADSVIEVAAAK
jgi:1,4-alpha-glucan branching enzyme